MGIEVTTALFSKSGLTKLFQKIKQNDTKYSANAEKMLVLQNDYINTIDAVIAFLQDKDATLAHSICKREMLPEASRFEHTDDLEKAFGNMGIQDKAKYIATMYLEDLSDLIKETVDEHFGFSRYAEKLGRSANSFDEMATLSKQHGMEMFQKGDTDHLQAINEMMELMKTPDAMNIWFENKRKEFDALPENM